MNKEIPLAVKAQKCSFIGMSTKEVSEVAKEICISNDEASLANIISMPLMNEVFVNLALSRLIAKRLASGILLEESQLKIKVKKDLFPKEILDKFIEGEQTNLPLGKIICKGDYLFLFLSSNNFVEHIVKFITNSSDYFTKN